METMIEFNNISKQYKKHFALKRIRHSWQQTGTKAFWALKDVSFEVDRGDFLGLIGPNGAGKSTILKILSGITRLSSGSFSCKGRIAAMMELGAGFQLELTGRENIFLNGSILGLSNREMRSKFDKIVDFAELWDFIDSPIKQYSSGMYVRLGFAVAAAIDPDILLIDEVLAVGDSAFQLKCRQRIAELVKNGVTVIFVSHDMQQVSTFCNKVIYLDKGQVKIIGAPEKVVPVYRHDILEKRKAQNFSEQAPEDIELKNEFLQITGVEVLGADGKAHDTFPADEQVRIDIAYKASREVTDAVVILEFYSPEGDLIMSSVSSRHGRPFEDIRPGSGVITAAFASLPLVSMTLRLDVLVMDGDRLYTYDIKRRAAEISLLHPDVSVGTIYQPSEWTHKRQ
jgi:ABC-type polysaccharide/polyol phosphate transport system ATPase subunit